MGIFTRNKSNDSIDAAIKAAAVTEPQPLEFDNEWLGHVQALLGQASWQDVLRTCAGNHGLVGSLIHELAKTQSMVDLRLIKHDCGMRTELDLKNNTADQVAQELFNSIRPAIGSLPDLVFQAAYQFELAGECFGIEYQDDNDRRVFGIASVRSLTQQEDGSWLWQQYSDPKRTPKRIEAGNVKRLHVPDPSNPMDAYTTWRCVVPLLEQLQLVDCLLGALVTAKFYTNGLLWAPIGNNESDWVTDYQKVLKQNLQNGKRNPNLMPFAFSSKDKPEFISVGDGVSERIMELQDNLITQVARASSVPTKLVLEGPGDASSWGDFMLERNFLRFTIEPKVTHIVCAITDWILTPRLDLAVQQQRMTADEAASYEIVANVDGLVNANASPADFTRGYQLGAIERVDLARKLGCEPAKLPEGVTEYEHWEKATGQLRGNNDVSRTGEMLNDFTDETGETSLGSEVFNDSPGDNQSDRTFSGPTQNVSASFDPENDLHLWIPKAAA